MHTHGDDISPFSVLSGFEPCMPRYRVCLGFVKTVKFERSKQYVHLCSRNHPCLCHFSSAYLDAWRSMLLIQTTPAKSSQRTTGSADRPMRPLETRNKSTPCTLASPTLPSVSLDLGSYIDETERRSRTAMTVEALCLHINYDDRE